MLDPSRRSSLDVLKLAQSLLTNQLPLTIGLVPVVSADPAVTGRQDAGVALTEAFNYALREEGSKAGLKALQLLIEVRVSPARLCSWFRGSRMRPFEMLSVLQHPSCVCRDAI